MSSLKKCLLVMALLFFTVSCGSSGTAPDTPSSLHAKGGWDFVTLTWNSVLKATSYNVYYSTSPNVTTSTGTKISNVTSPYTQEGLTHETTYYYIVTAVNNGAEGEASEEVSAVANFGGVLDTSYADNGFFETSVAMAADMDATIDVNGDIFFAEYVSEYSFIIVKLKASGSYDESFGTGGVAEYSCSSSCGEQLLLVSDGSTGILVVFSNATNFILTKVKSDGAIDTSFGTSGYVNIDSSMDIQTGIFFDNTSILLAGSYDDGLKTVFMVQKRKISTGALDTSFGTSGVFTYQYESTTQSSAETLQLDADKNIYIGGYYIDGDATALMITINPDGSVPSYGVSPRAFFPGQVSDILSEDGLLYVSVLTETETSQIGTIHSLYKTTDYLFPVSQFGGEGYVRYSTLSMNSMPALIVGGTILVTDLATSNIGITTVATALNKTTGEVDQDVFTNGLYEGQTFLPFWSALTSDGVLYLGIKPTAGYYVMTLAKFK